MRKTLYILPLFLLGCWRDPAPNIVTKPGIEYCGAFCSLMREKNCVEYYADTEIEDGGIMTCEETCAYLMSNSIQLNVKCIVEKFESCQTIETICPN